MLQHLLGRDARARSVRVGRRRARTTRWRAAVGIGTATEAPDDPALARLFPDGYTDDPEASAEFRRYTEPGAARRPSASGRAHRAGHAADEPAARSQLDADQAAGLAAARSTTSGWRSGSGSASPRTWRSWSRPSAEDDPRLALLEVYDWLTYLQESLVQALWARRSR